MAKNIDKLELSIMHNRKSKFQPDLEDYNKDVVYNWHVLRKKNRTPRSILKHRNYDSRSTLDDDCRPRVSFSSFEFETSDSHNLDCEVSFRARTRSCSRHSSNDCNDHCTDLVIKY